MKKRFLRIGAGVAAAVISAGALFMFAGCTSDHPEVRITYEFNGKEYKVDYVLSRNDAPQTVTHFLELADVGFYDGMIIHDYQDDALYTGGYTLENGELTEVDYFTRVRELEESENMKFTQTVYRDEERTDPLYTVYGEFERNGLKNLSRENNHRKGALVMYYTAKGSSDVKVTVKRADGGKGNDGIAWQRSSYALNSATSLFYTYTGSSTNYTRGEEYCVFGKVKDYDAFEDGLLQAIADYIDAHTDEANEFSVTETQEDVKLNAYEPFADIVAANVTADFETPIDMPIIVKSVKVTKY